MKVELVFSSAGPAALKIETESEQDKTLLKAYCGDIGGSTAVIAEDMTRQSSELFCHETRRTLIVELRKEAPRESVIDQQAFEDRLEAAFWKADATHKGHGEWHERPRSERDAFKAVVRELLLGVPL